MPQLNPIDISTLPEQAQIELYDFYLFLKQRYQIKKVTQQQQSRIEGLNALKVKRFMPPSRDEIYER